MPHSKEDVFVTDAVSADAVPSVLPLQQLRTLSLGCRGSGAMEYRNALVCLELQSLSNLRDELVLVSS